MNNLAQRFSSILPQERLLSDVLMAENTTMRVGGPADLFVSPRSVDEILEVVHVCQSEGIPLFVLGNGSNVIFSVIHIELSLLQIFSLLYGLIEIPNSLLYIGFFMKK